MTPGRKRGAPRILDLLLAAEPHHALPPQSLARHVAHHFVGVLGERPERRDRQALGADEADAKILVPRQQRQAGGRQPFGDLEADQRVDVADHAGQRVDRRAPRRLAAHRSVGIADEAQQQRRLGAPRRRQAHRTILVVEQRGERLAAQALGEGTAHARLAVARQRADPRQRQPQRDGRAHVGLGIVEERGEPERRGVARGKRAHLEIGVGEMALRLCRIGGEEPIDPSRPPVHDADPAEVAPAGGARLVVGAVGAGHRIAQPVEWAVLDVERIAPALAHAALLDAAVRPSRRS